MRSLARAAAVLAAAACTLGAVHGTLADAPPREVLDEQRAALAFVAPVGLSVVGARLLFSAFHVLRGQELWASDGTPQGTTIVKDIRPGFQGSFPSGHVVFGSALYFAADDGQSGVELWRSDGTTAGTVRVADIDAGPRGSTPNAMTVWGDALLFVADDGASGFQLWKTRGDAASTQRITTWSRTSARGSSGD